jgi:hypothetical protein
MIYEQNSSKDISQQKKAFWFAVEPDRNFLQSRVAFAQSLLQQIKEGLASIIITTVVND